MSCEPRLALVEIIIINVRLRFHTVWLLFISDTLIRVACLPLILIWVSILKESSLISLVDYFIVSSL